MNHDLLHADKKNQAKYEDSDTPASRRRSFIFAVSASEITCDFLTMFCPRFVADRMILACNLATSSPAAANKKVTFLYSMLIATLYFALALLSHCFCKPRLWYATAS